jgi:hypothetical protein
LKEKRKAADIAAGIDDYNDRKARKEKRKNKKEF